MRRADLAQLIVEAIAEMRDARERIVTAEARIGCAFDTVETEADQVWFVETVSAQLVALKRETDTWAALVRPTGVH